MRNSICAVELEELQKTRGVSGVVKGVATVTRGDEIFLLKQNESTYIPLGVKHRLANPGNENLELIEVQSGLYLGEDDIIRFDDVYGRNLKEEAVT